MADQNLGETSHVDALGKAENFAGDFFQTEKYTEPLDSSEVERTKKASKYNLRKSLAWDVGFFTSAGVLDPDELSSMIDGGSGGKRQVLPVIEEDIHRSTDSQSTLGSENLSLESLEFDFFQDIRASIQKSSKASNGANPYKAVLVNAENQGTLSLKDDLASKNVANSSAGPKKQANRIQTPGKLKVQSFNRPQGTGKLPAAGTGVLTPSVQKATKVNGRSIAGPSAAVGRPSLRANKVQLENDKAKALHKVAPVPKVPGFSGSTRTVPKPVLSSKSFSSSSSTATKKVLPKSSSSSDSSTSIADSNRRKVASRSVNPTSSNSILQTPSKVGMKKKGENGLSASLRPSRLSSSISPASSISEWSVASSSSTSSVNQCSSTMRAITVSGSPHKSQDNAATSINDRGLDRAENKVSRPYSEKPNAAAAQMGPPPKPATAKPSGLRITGPPPKLETAKPSGLRMPSPKIGFFDGAKPVVNTPSGSSQSRSGPKVGPIISTPTGVSSKAKSPNFQPTRLVKPIRNIKLDTLKSASPLPSKKVSNASTMVHNSPKLVETPLNLLTLTRSETNEKKLLKTEETGVKKLCETNGGESEMVSLVDVDKNSTKLVNLKIVPADEDMHDCMGKIASVEKNDDLKLISEENDIADDFKSKVDLDKQMSSNLVNSKIVPMNGDIYDCEGKMASEGKSKDVKSITEKFSPSDLKSEMNLDKKLSANLVNVNIDPVSGEIYDSEGKMASQEKNNDVTSITEEFNPVELKSEMNLNEKLTANSVNVNIDPVDGEIYDSEGKMASEGKNNEVTSVTDKISTADVKNDMNFDVKISANSGDMATVPVDGKIYYSQRKMQSKEKSYDFKSSTEQIFLADLKTNMNLEVKMSANSGNMEIVPLDGNIYDCQEKMVSEEKCKDAISINKKINVDDLESDIKLDVKSYDINSVNYMIVPVDGDIGGNVVCEEKVDDVKLNTEKTVRCHVICDTNLDEKSSANLVNMNAATVDADISDREMVYDEKWDDRKPEMQRLIHGWNSLQKSAEDGQVGGLSLDVRQGYSEHDLQKENGSNFISGPRDFAQTEELLSNSSKINLKSEIVGSTRTPFTDKNSTCNDYDLSTELSAEGMEMITLLPSLECPPA